MVGPVLAQVMVLVESVMSVKKLFATIKRNHALNSKGKGEGKMNAVLKSEWSHFNEGLEEVVRLRENISLFGGFGDAQVEGIVNSAIVKHVKAGSKIFEQGEQPSEIYLVLRGRVTETVERENGTVIRTDYKEGDCFGEAAVIGIMPQAGNAEASANTKLLLISREALMVLAEKDQSLFSLFIMNIARDVSRRLRCVLLDSNN